MLSLTIPPLRLFHEENNTFDYFPEVTVKLEHSLLSVRRWESKWHKSYLSTASSGMTIPEALDYARCMCLDQSIDPKVFDRLTKKNYETIMAYINDPMTATTFRENKQRGPQKILTAEVIYGIMVENGIPFECEKWHLNQLFTLIRVCTSRGVAGKKQSKAETAAMYSMLNQARRKRTGSRG